MSPPQRVLLFGILGIVMATGLPFFKPLGERYLAWLTIFGGEFGTVFNFAIVTLCVVLIIVFVLRSKKDWEDDSQALWEASEHAYLLGYLMTISGLLGFIVANVLLFDGGKTVMTDQFLTNALFIGTLKLATTVAGLLGMLYLRTVSLSTLDTFRPTVNFSSRESEEILEEFSRRMIAENQEGLVQLEKLRGALRVAIVDLESEFTKVKAAAELSAEALNTVEGKVTSTTNAIDKMGEKATSTANILGKVSPEVATFNDRMNGLEKIFKGYLGQWKQQLQ